MPTPPDGSGRLKKLLDDMFGGPLPGLFSVPTPNEKIVVTCKACGQKNRYSILRKGTPRCGNCGIPLS